MAKTLNGEDAGYVERDFGSGVLTEMRQEREARIEKEPSLLDDKTRRMLEAKIAQEANLPLEEAKDIVDNINCAAGHELIHGKPAWQRDKQEASADTLGVIKAALSGHVESDKFINRIAKEIQAIVDVAIDAREKHMETVAKAEAKGPSVAANVLKQNPPKL